jgi:hypothetical protein
LATNRFFRGIMKKSNAINLLIAPILSTILVAACNSGGDETTRDVYENAEDCLKDWGDSDLCQEMNDEDSEDYKRRGGVYKGGKRLIWGPNYYPGDRSVSYKGKTISPTSKSTSMSPFTVSSRSSSASRSGVSSPSRSSSGGFGSRSSSSGGGGGS